MIKFNKYNVTNGALKARIWYTTNADGSICLHEKDYSSTLGKLFADEVRNDTDMMSDYFKKDRVIIRVNHPLFAAARERMNKNKAA